VRTVFLSLLTPRRLKARVSRYFFFILAAKLLSHHQKQFLGIIVQLLTQIRLIIQVEFIQLFQK